MCWKRRQFGWSLFFALALGVQMSASAYLGPPFSEPDRVWFALLVQSPIRDYREFEYDYQLRAPKSENEPVPVLAMEIRREDQTPVVTVPLDILQDCTKIPTAINASQRSLTKEFSRMKNFAGFSEGAFVAAITANGERCSNIAPFHVDAAFNPASQPPLEIVALEPPPFYALPYLGIRANGIAPPSRPDSLAYPRVVVDDVPRGYSVMVGGSCAPQMGEIAFASMPSAGRRLLSIKDVSGNLTPPIEPGVEHTLQIKASGHTAGPIAFGPEQPLAKAWDNATRSMLEKTN